MPGSFLWASSHSTPRTQRTSTRPLGGVIAPLMGNLAIIYLVPVAMFVWLKYHKFKYKTQREGERPMRIAVFSDIHSNLSAFQAAVAYASHLGAEGFAFLGDLISDGPDPGAVLDSIRALSDRRPCWFVRGNREEMMLDHHKNKGLDDWIPSHHYGSFLYTYENLSSDDLRFLSAMPLTAHIQIPGCPPILMCHGSLQDTHALIYPGSEAAEQLLKQADTNTVLAGHCHLQYRYESSGKQLINPGAIDTRSNGQVRARFALLRCEEGRWIARLLSAEYNAAAELRRYEGSGLIEAGGPYTRVVMHALRTGIFRGECLQLARQLSGTDKYDFIPDAYWDTAAEQLGI